MHSLLFLKASPNHIKIFDRFSRSARKIGSVETDVIDIREELLNSVLGRLRVNKKSQILYKVFLKVDHLLWPFILIIFRKSVIEYIKKRISSRNVSALIVCDHYFGLLQALFIKAGREVGVKTYCIPFVYHRPEDVKRGWSENENLVKKTNGMVGSFIAKKYPKWVFEWKDKKVLWRLPSEVIGIKMLGMDLDDPSAGGSEHYQRIFISGDIAEQRFRSYGVKRDKLCSVGDVAFDFFQSPENRRVDGKKTIVYSIVPFIRGHSRGNLYGSYNGYIASYIKVLKEFDKAGWRVICNPHPNTPEDVCSLFEAQGLEVIKNDMAEVISMADLYITSYSTTLLWAAALGIPAIDHDIYSMGHFGTNEISTIKTIRGLPEFDKIVSRLISFEDNLFNELTSLASTNKSHFVNQSGGVVLRILDEIDSDKELDMVGELRSIS